ncbi:MAG TPA: MarR family winged helix-turn-helix transcriptional regulator [Candidatus Saccharimonadales bacterium]|jgi:DNA-binding MarR family transcriptional regulator
MQHIELPRDYALVLQTVHENGEEDFANLAETLRFDRQRLAHIIEALRHKGLIYLNRSTRSSSDAWIRLSAKGRKCMTNIWPESTMNGAAYSY